MKKKKIYKKETKLGTSFVRLYWAVLREIHGDILKIFLICTRLINDGGKLLLSVEKKI